MRGNKAKRGDREERGIAVGEAIVFAREAASDCWWRFRQHWREAATGVAPVGLAF